MRIPLHILWISFHMHEDHRGFELGNNFSHISVIAQGAYVIYYMCSGLKGLPGHLGFACIN